jgi:hypothetical protein
MSFEKPMSLSVFIILTTPSTLRKKKSKVHKELRTFQAFFFPPVNGTAGRKNVSS